MFGPFSARALGATNLEVSPLGLGSSFGLPGKHVERAFDEGVRFFLWGALRRGDFGRGLRAIAKRDREGAVIAVQSYTRVGALMATSVDRALRELDTDYIDVLGLGWWNSPPPRRIVDAAIALRERGKVRHLMISCHDRPTLAGFVDDPAYDALMIRYNAAHPGAERDFFPALERRRVGTIAFTATRWGSLLDPQYTPEGDDVPRASDCYRFALSNPSVDVCLAGPKNGHELDEALAALSRGPLSAEEMAWMRRVGAAVRSGTKTERRGWFMSLADRVATAATCAPRQLTPPSASA